MMEDEGERVSFVPGVSSYRDRRMVLWELAVSIWVGVPSGFQTTAKDFLHGILYREFSSL